MGSKPGGVFGAIANMEQNIRDKVSPVAKVLDPSGTFLTRENNNWINKPWLNLRNAAQRDQLPPSKAPIEPSQAGTANAPKASSGASTSGGGGARDMVTSPPNTPEGNKMRFGQTTLLGVT